MFKIFLLHTKTAKTSKFYYLYRFLTKHLIGKTGLQMHVVRPLLDRTESLHASNVIKLLL